MWFVILQYDHIVNSTSATYRVKNIAISVMTQNYEKILTLDELLGLAIL